MRASRYLLAVGAIAVLAIVLIVGFQLRDRNATVANPSASTTPSDSGATIFTPSASASATSSPCVGPCDATGPAFPAIYNDDFGFIVTDVGAGATIRSESSNTRRFPFSAQGFAVSADGRQVAYWTVSSGSQPSQLRVFNALGNATEQTWVTLAAGQRGSGIAWSSDGAGLLYSTDTGNFGVGGGTNSATLDVFEFAVGGRRGTIDTQTNTGWLYRPLAWDRSVNLAAAFLTGEGAGMSYYVTVRINPDNSFSAQRVDTRGSNIAMNTIRASNDAKFVLGVEFDPAIGSANVKFWPLADVGARKTASGNGKAGARWQPGTHKIGLISGDGFVLFQVEDGSAATPFRGVKAGSFVQTFRVDGSAVVLAVPTDIVLGPTDYTLIRLADGASVTFQDLGGLTVSVKLR